MHQALGQRQDVLGQVSARQRLSDQRKALAIDGLRGLDVVIGHSDGSLSLIVRGLWPSWLLRTS